MIHRLARKKAALFFSILLSTIIVALPVFIYEARISSRPVTSIERAGYNEGEKVITLYAVTDDGHREKVTVDVNERKFTKDELSRFSKELDDKLWKVILGKSADPAKIVDDLELPDHVDAYPFDITWKSDSPLILSSSGVINEEKLTEADPDDVGVNVQLRATLKYEDYTEDKYSYVTIFRKKNGENESAKELIEQAVKESDELSATSKEQILPKAAGGRKVSFYEASAHKGWAVLLCGIVIAILFPAIKDRKIKDEAENRRRQMESDYPRILGQYTLYYIAGMNPRAIWSAICDKYEENLAGNKKMRRYAYEEMINTKNRMDEGCGELAAYDEFASRCDDMNYRSFISFVKQAVVKGNEGLDDLLSDLADKAQREKNNRAKMEAAEAETRMLLPMFMMLIVVLVVVMVPALIGLNG